MPGRQKRKISSRGEEAIMHSMREVTASGLGSDTSKLEVFKVFVNCSVTSCRHVLYVHVSQFLLINHPVLLTSSINMSHLINIAA